jgi:hypothetical protein
MAYHRTTNDREIRQALHQTELAGFHVCKDTLVVDELALAHAAARIDIAVINGCVHGYEIKSSIDSLARLPRQIELYAECLEKLTIVCAPKHLLEVKRIAPPWCGIVEVTKGTRNAISFRTCRKAKRNKGVSVERLAHLLWRDEAAKILSQYEDVPRPILRQPRKTLYAELSKRLTTSEITHHIKTAMAGRPTWRDLQAHASCGG